MNSLAPFRAASTLTDDSWQETAEQVFRHGFPDIAHFAISPVSALKFKLSLKGPQRADDRPEYSLTDFIIDFDDCMIKGGNLDSRRHDGKTGRRLFAYCCVLGQVLGLDSMEFQASALMGAFIWSKAGAQEVIYEQPKIKMLGEMRLKEIESRLDRETARLVRTLLNFEISDSLRHLALLSQPVSRAGYHFERTAGIDFKKYRDRGLFISDVMPLGAFILAGQTFMMREVFKNQAQQNLLDAYCRINIAGISQSLARQFVTQPTPRAAHSSSPAVQMAHQL